MQPLPATPNAAVAVAVGRGWPARAYCTRNALRASPPHSRACLSPWVYRLLHNSKRASGTFRTWIRSGFFAAYARSTEINVAVFAHDKTKICQCLFLWPKCLRTYKVKSTLNFYHRQHVVLGIIGREGYPRNQFHQTLQTFPQVYNWWSQLPFLLLAIVLTLFSWLQQL